jgi:tRNA(Met) cytidine acetyltransferase
VSGRFLGRLARILAESTDVVRVEQGRPLPRVPPGTAAAPAVAAVAPYATEDQRLAVDALRRVALGRARRPLLLIADRGRGKSAAFGIAAAELLAMEPKRILLTGPRLDAVQAVFEHAARLLPDARRQPDALLQDDGGWLRFIAPDALALERPDADLVLVDEAAALPVPLLTRLLRQYPRIAFATTVHGYEGTGRGFLLRFVQTLKAQSPGWRRLRLEAPISWAPEDPLERLSFRLLLLDAEAVAEDELAASERLRIERLDRDALAGDEARLSELFGLLLQAHYRTRPFDLRHLLDGPNVEIYALFSGEHVVGAALVVLEGGLNDGIGAAVAEGKRRLRGHLISQSLAFHLGLAGGAGMHCARIMRLAIHPAWQRRGLGRQLVAALVADATRRGLDLAGSSFGGDVSLLRFWQRCGFLPARVGMTRGSNSGEHALLLLRGLSRPGQELRHEARRRFLRDLPDQLAQPLRGLEPLLAIRLLEGEEFLREAPDAADRQQLAAFAFGRRNYGDSLGALRRFVLHMCARQDMLERVPAQRLELLAAAVLQGRSWGEVAALGGLAGRDDAMQAVREALAQLADESHLFG